MPLLPVIIKQEPDLLLRQIAKMVPLTDCGAPWLKKLVSGMSTTLAACPDGVALAAPQIGESWRLFIVGERAFPKRDTAPHWDHDLVFINPVITRRSRRQAELTEGCLSVRHRYGTTVRPERVSVEAYDQNGHKFVRHASGLLAQVFQHEIEHLDGIIFIDHARNLHEVPSNEKQN